MAEGEVAAGVAVEVEAVRCGERRRVAVRGSGGDEHREARRDVDSADAQVLRAVTEGGRAHRGVEAEQFVEGAGDQLRVPAQAVERLRVPEQGQDGVADEVGGGLVPGDQEEGGQGDGLVPVEAALLAVAQEGVERAVAGVARAVPTRWVR